MDKNDRDDSGVGNCINSYIYLKFRIMINHDKLNGIASPLGHLGASLLRLWYSWSQVCIRYWNLLHSSLGP